MMELKQKEPAKVETAPEAYNRTMMELKLGWFIASCTTGILIIVP